MDRGLKEHFEQRYVDVLASTGHDDHDDAEFEAFFLDDYWKVYADYSKALGMPEWAQRGAGTKPVYLVEDGKEALRKVYYELLETAKQWAQKPCSTCGSSNVDGHVRAGISKFKAQIDCRDCGAQWF
jgi:hypothetical protein